MTGPPQRRRRKPRFHRRAQPGAMPGTLIVSPDAHPCIIHAIAYGPERMIERQVRDPHSLRELLRDYRVTWVNVVGLGDAKTLSQFGEIFQLHPLALEDVVNVHQRAKVEPYNDQLFVVGRMVEWQKHVQSEQVSIFLGSNYVLSFQERPGDGFAPLRERMLQSGGRYRHLGPDYLVYALLDAVIDSYFPVVEQLADRLDDIDDEVTLAARPTTIERLHQARNDLLVLRRAIYPQREALNQLVRDEHPLIHPETRVFLRDCYDHTIQVIDLVEVYREMCADLRDYYVSVMSQRMNEVMTVLTVIATIFVPLTFIVGLYGMNFDTSSPWNMPELHWRFGYLAVWFVMLLVPGLMLIFFRRRGWLRWSARDRPLDSNSQAPLQDRGNRQSDADPSRSTRPETKNAGCPPLRRTSG